MLCVYKHVTAKCRPSCHRSVSEHGLQLYGSDVFSCESHQWSRPPTPRAAPSRRPFAREPADLFPLSSLAGPLIANRSTPGGSVCLTRAGDVRRLVGHLRGLYDL